MDTIFMIWVGINQDCNNIDYKNVAENHYQ